MEEQKVVEELSSIKESIKELAKAVSDALELEFNSINVDLGAKKKISLTSKSKTVEELLSLADKFLSTQKDK